MKLVKKTLIVSIFGLLPAILLATQHNKKQHKLCHLSHTAQVNSQPVKPISTTPTVASTPNVTAPTKIAAPTKIVSDITPTTRTTLKKTWLKNSEIREIIRKAQKNGQLFYVMHRLDKMQLPKSLALIPIIESQYKNTARSNKGAGGIWQLMPATARQLGIKSSERFQLARSTDAALKYFRDLHKQFGSWELAIAAYNAGDGRVRHALHLNPKARNVQELKLPKETKQYVLKFYALENYISAANV